MSIKQGGNTIAGLQDISGKANVALDNLTSAGKEVCANLAMPSNRYIDLTLGASGSSYTAPADGYFTYMDHSSGVGMACLANWTNGLVNGINAPASTWLRRVFLPVKKGDVVELLYENGGTSQIFRFVYAQGAQ